MSPTELLAQAKRRLSNLTPERLRVAEDFLAYLKALADSGCSQPAASTAELTAEARALERLACARLTAALLAVAGPEPVPALLRAAYECSLHRQIAARRMPSSYQQVWQLVT